MNDRKDEDMSDKPEALTAQQLQSLRNLGNESESAADEIARLRPLTFCGCGDQFTAHDPGTCGACVAGGNTGLHIEIDSLHAECEEWRKLRDPAVLHVNLLRGIPARLDDATLWHMAGGDQKVAELRAECERLRAALSESAHFWAHYSSLNESEQDELNPQRHKTLDAMRAAIRATPTEPKP